MAVLYCYNIKNGILERDIMSKELPRTYKSFTEWPEKSKQTEYTEETPLLAEDGTLLAKGWARHNVFTYNRDHSKPNWRKKEWDFYVIRNKDYVVDLSFANIFFTVITPIRCTLCIF